MKTLINLSRSMLCLLLLIALVGCATTSSNEPKGGATTDKESNSGVKGKIPPDSKFAKISKGMSQKQVQDLIGPPTDSATGVTWKAYIPFYFGSDRVQTVDLYKGEGQVIYVGVSSSLVDQIIYDPNETGYNK